MLVDLCKFWWESERRRGQEKLECKRDGWMYRLEALEGIRMILNYSLLDYGGDELAGNDAESGDVRKSRGCRG